MPRFNTQNLLGNLGSCNLIVSWSISKLVFLLKFALLPNLVILLNAIDVVYPLLSKRSILNKRFNCNMTLTRRMYIWSCIIKNIQIDLEFIGDKLRIFCLEFVNHMNFLSIGLRLFINFMYSCKMLLQIKIQ